MNIIIKCHTLCYTYIDLFNKITSKCLLLLFISFLEKKIKNFHEF